MEKYVNYLVQDILAAMENVPHYLMGDEEEEDLEFLTPDEEAKDAPRKPLGLIAGLDPNWFPPEERLEDDQLLQILDALNDCLDAYGFILNFPLGLPSRQRYAILAQQLRKEVPVLKYNTWQIDFCNYDTVACPFGARYCQCKVYEKWLDQLQSSPEPSDGPASLPDFLLNAENAIEQDAYYYRGDAYGYEYEEEDEWEEDEEEDGVDPTYRRFWDPGFRPEDDDDGQWN
ncbi:hypothetical protein [Phaeodactylibacter luteus]|uniref:Uncharacterized protein n=1 Tax=Phaeodactylibacter luteus TaxID=1564516 RepID=A0A5C6RUD6_9BACT|nr:hypothetical protein [Phaeodactylibacter luteus]TXB65604.1 hypothetical protein FRY97_06375 [Phaeodactylibacter luteus]